jgi:predicted membrane protein
VFQLTTTGRAANKPHFAAILSVDGEFLCLLTRIILIVTGRRVMKKERKKERKKQAKKNNEIKK